MSAVMSLMSSGYQPGYAHAINLTFNALFSCTYFYKTMFHISNKSSASTQYFILPGHTHIVSHSVTHVSVISILNIKFYQQYLHHNNTNAFTTLTVSSGFSLLTNICCLKPEYYLLLLRQSDNIQYLSTIPAVLCYSCTARHITVHVQASKADG